MVRKEDIHTLAILLLSLEKEEKDLISNIEELGSRLSNDLDIVDYKALKHLPYKVRSGWAKVSKEETEDAKRYHAIITVEYDGNKYGFGYNSANKCISLSINDDKITFHKLFEYPTNFLKAQEELNAVEDILDIIFN